MKGTFQHHLRFTCIAVFLLSFAFGQVAAQETPPLDFEWQHFENAKMLDGDPWSPDNRYLAVGSLEGNAVLLLDRETWEVAERLELPATEQEVSTLRWSADGNYFAVATYDELIVIDVSEGNYIQITNQFPAIAGTEIRWMGDMNVLAVLDNKGMITLIDVVEPKVIREIELDDYGLHEGFIYTAFDWNSHFDLFAAPFYYTDTIGFWDAFGNLPSSLVRESENEFYRLASQCNGLGTDDSLTPEFDFFGMGGNVNLLDMQWSNDGMRLAFTEYNRIVVCTLSPAMTAVTNIWELGIPNPAYYPDNDEIGLSPYKMPRAVSWSPDDHWLLVSQFYIPPGMSEDSCGIAVFDAAQDFAYMGKIGEEFCRVWSMSWNSDGSQLAVGNGSDGYWIGTLQENE